MSGAVLDTGVLIGLERPGRLALGDVVTARRHRDPIIIPAGCVAQAWRDGDRQVPLARLLRSSATTIEALDGRTARRVGELLRRTGTSDVVDAHVAFIAMRDHRTIYTSDPDDLRRLAPSAAIVEV